MENDRKIKVMFLRDHLKMVDHYLDDLLTACKEFKKEIFSILEAEDFSISKVGWYFEMMKHHTALTSDFFCKNIEEFLEQLRQEDKNG